MSIRFSSSAMSAAYGTPPVGFTLMGWYMWIAAPSGTNSQILLLDGNTMLESPDNTSTAALQVNGSYFGSQVQSLNRWYHAALTRASNTNGAACQLYINGVLLSSTTLAGGAFFNVGLSFANTQFFNGRIAAVKAWNAVLGSDEIQREMWAVAPIRQSKLYLWVPGIPGTDRLVDRSPAHIAVTVSGSPTDEEQPPIPFVITPLVPFLATSGATVINGTLSQTLGALTDSTAAVVLVQGAATPTLGSILDATAVAILVQAASTPTLGALTDTTGAGVLVQGSATPTLGALAISADGSVTSGITGTLSQTLGALTDTTAGAVAVQGAATPTLGALTDSTAGAVAVQGTATPTLGALTDTTAGAVAVQGTSTPTLGALTISAAGTVGAASATGDANITLGALTDSGAGQVAIAASLSQNLTALTSGASGGALVTGQLVRSLDALTLFATNMAQTGFMALAISAPGASLAVAGASAAAAVSGPGAALTAAGNAAGVSIVANGSVKVTL